MSNQELLVKKRNGTIQPLMLDKLHLMVEEACRGLSGVSASLVEMNSGIQFYDGITTDEIQKILIKSASDLISLDAPNYQYVAARLLLFSTRKQIYGGAEMPTLYDHIRKCVDLGVYDEKILESYTEEEINKIDSFIDHERDFIFTFAGLSQVVDKYLVQDRSNGTLYETPQFMYIMVSLVLFSKYDVDVRLKYVKKYYDAISKHKINIPTPVMAGVRTKLKQFASCCLIDVDDTLDSIIASDGAMTKYISGRAGIGLNLGRLRGIGSKIRNGEVVSTGIIPFVKKFEASLNSCHQGGIRKGSMTIYFPIWHQEIEDIIVLKNNKGTEENRARKVDYGIQLSKIFWERFIKNEDITLFSPHDVPGLYDMFGTSGFDDLYIKYENDPLIPKKKVNSQKLILELLKERAETGRIYLMNIDHVNSHSPFKEQITMSNLCVAGETKIKIRYYNASKNEENDKDLFFDRFLYKEIEIKDLDKYMSSRSSILDNYRVNEFFNSFCDIASQIEVLSYNIETQKREWKFIKAFAEISPKAEVIKITSGEFSVVVTPDHKIYTLNRGYVMAKELTVYDQLIFEDWTQDDSSRLKIEYLDEQVPVYDITVDSTHNFFANGILVSNCTEIVIPTKPIQDLTGEGEIALCILSAMNVGKIKIEDELEDLCDLTVRALDELIDYQEYPVKAAEYSAKARRTLGVGIIGLAHYFAKIGCKYEDKEATSAAHSLAESIQYYLLKASNQVAREKGPCEFYNKTTYSEGILPIDTYKKDVDEICSEPLKHDWEELRENILKYGLRNSTHSCILPSESSSVTSNATNGIEPPRGLLSIKKSKKGPIKQIVPNYSTLKNNYTLLWDMKSNIGYLNIVAVIQKFFDQTISANTNYNPENYPNNEVPMSDIVQDVLYAYKMGVKTLYYHNTNDGKSDEPKDDNNELNSLVSELLDSEEEMCESCAI